MTVFCRPPTSALCSIRAADRHAAELRCQEPRPSPARSIEPRDDLGTTAPISSDRGQCRNAGEEGQEAQPRPPYGVKRRKDLRPTDGGHEQGDREGEDAQPGVDKQSPSATDRNSGTTKNRPA